MSFLSGFVLDAIPGWAPLFELPPADRLAALAEPELRRALAASAASREAGTLRALTRWERMTIQETFADGNRRCEGRSIGELAQQHNADPFDVLIDLVIADELRTGIILPSEEGDAAAWEVRAASWLDDRTVLGGSDAGAHLDMQCCANYPTALLGESVRERGLLTVEQAVQQLSDVPARLYGLSGRGRIAEGWFGDLVLFDPATVASTPVHTVADLPGGAERLTAEAVGVSNVIVNGSPVVEDGRYTGELSGQLLRSGRDTSTRAAASVVGRRPGQTR